MSPDLLYSISKWEIKNTSKDPHLVKSPVVLSSLLCLLLCQSVRLELTIWEDSLLYSIFLVIVELPFYITNS